MFEVTYDAVARCVSRVDALNEESAAAMVSTGEAGDIEGDVIWYERRVVGVQRITPALTNRDTGDEQA